MDINDIGTIAAIIVGTGGLGFSISNFLRDAPKVILDLRWDMSPFNLPGFDDDESVGVITVTNTGRRTIYVSHVAIELPRGGEDKYLLIGEGIKGEKLEEGAPPLFYPVKQEGLDKYARHWKKMRAQVTDSTGKVWKSPKQNVSKPPSWAKSSE